MHQVQLLAIWWHMEITSTLFLNGNSFLLQQYCIIIFVTFCTACNFIIFLHCFHVKSGAYFIPRYFWWWRAMQWTLQYQPSVEQNSVPELNWHISRHFWRLWNVMKYMYVYILTNSVWFSVSWSHEILALCAVTHTGKKSYFTSIQFSKTIKTWKIKYKICNSM